MASRTSSELPVWRPDKSASRLYTDKEHPLARPGMEDLAGAVAENGEEVHPLEDLLYRSGEEFVKSLLGANLFITGKVGMGELILDKLKGLVAGLEQDRQVRAVDIYTLTDLSQKARKTVQGKILVTLPIVEDCKALNKLVSRALRKAMPVWLIGWPSLIGKHLLVSFDAFFVAADIPEEELAPLVGVTPLENQHIERMNELKADALFVAAYPIPQLASGKTTCSIMYLMVD